MILLLLLACSTSPLFSSAKPPLVKVASIFAPKPVPGLTKEQIKQLFGYLDTEYQKLERTHHVAWDLNQSLDELDAQYNQLLATKALTEKGHTATAELIAQLITASDKAKKPYFIKHPDFSKFDHKRYAHLNEPEKPK